MHTTKIIKTYIYRTIFCNKFSFYYDKNMENKLKLMLILSSLILLSNCSNTNDQLSIKINRKIENQGFHR
jgi:hypothetical protein